MRIAFTAIYCLTASWHLVFGIRFLQGKSETLLSRWMNVSVEEWALYDMEAFSRCMGRVMIFLAILWFAAAVVSYFINVQIGSVIAVNIGLVSTLISTFNKRIKRRFTL